MPEKVAIVGAGIVGLAHAWREAVHGAQVTLFERNPLAQDASVRNFGMIWPIGQPPELLPAALISRRLWGELLSATGLWHNQQGALFVARRADEWQVLQEFAASAGDYGYLCRLLTADESLQKCPGLIQEGLLGTMHSSSELGVDPREVCARLPHWLAERYQVQLRFNTTVRAIDLPVLESANGETWHFDRAIVASGADFATLYPQVFRDHGLSKCKLQMLRTRPQPDRWRLGPLIAGGLSLRHYASFEHCQGIAELRERIASELPELDKFGIHVMAAQNGCGEVVIGDSHEYGSPVTPFNNESIDEQILREAQQLVDLPDWRISARWHAVYAIREGHRHPQFVYQPADGVTIVIATGGAGMTMSFGLAEETMAN